MEKDERIKLVVRGLGRSEISVGSLTLVPDAGMLFPLALLLGQRAGERIPRVELRELVWPDASEESGRHSLRQALYRLHKAGLASDDRGDDILVDPCDVDSDLTEVLRDEWPKSAGSGTIESASSVLPGFAPASGSAFFDFTEQVRARVAAQHRRAVLARISGARREGRWREVEHWALLGLKADPLNEEATLARAEALAMVGAKYEALEFLDVYLRELGDRAKVIGLPARMLRHRISELADPSGRRVTATSAPFVGRHDVLARVQDALAEGRAGAATALWLVGPPGIGKSRLLREIERASRMAGWTVVRGNGRPSHGDRPFALLTDMLPGLLDAPGALGAAPHALSLMRKMGTVNTDEEPLPPEEARVRQHAVYHAWVELMDAVLAELPLALLLDDVHWSDPLTLLVLARFMETRPRARLAVMLCARRVPTRDDAAAARLLSSAEVRIAPLTDVEIREYTSGAGLAVDERFEEVTQQLGRASGGNPLFLSHLVHQHQHEQRQDVGDVPGDLASLIDGQLRTLSREATRLLQACALLGQHARLPRIERALGIAAPTLVSAFGELDDMLALPTDAGVPLAPHDLWTERVRRGMTSGVFRSLAVSVARVLEADAETDGSIDVYWDAARLYQESGEKQLAYATMMRCAEYLMRTGAAAEASRAYLAASELAETPAPVAKALLGRIRTLQAMGEWDECARSLSTLRDMAPQLHEAGTAHEIEFLGLQADWHSIAGTSASIDRIKEFLASHPEAVDYHARAGLLGMMAADNMFDDDALRGFYQVVIDATPSDPSAHLVRTQAELVYRTTLGEFDAACTVGRQLVAMARRSGMPANLIHALRLAAYPFRRSGAFDEAINYLEEGSQLARRHHFWHALNRNHELLAWLLIDQGNPELALEHLDRCHIEPIDGGTNFASFSLPLARIIANARTDRWPEAERLADGLHAKNYDLSSRARALAAAAKLLIFARKTDLDRCTVLLREIESFGRDMFRRVAQDVLAEAYSRGLSVTRGEAAAADFARWYLAEARLDRFPPPSALVELGRDRGRPV